MYLQVDLKESTSVVGSNPDKREDQQRSADSSPLTRKIRVGDQQVKVRDSNDWMGDHGHQEESLTNSETPEVNHHRSSKQGLDERGLFALGHRWCVSLYFNIVFFSESKRRKIDGGSSSKVSIKSF